MEKKSKEFLFNYLNANSASGFETEGQKIWLDYMKPYVDDYYADTYGTVVGIINPDAPYKVVIEAHADEISWLVSYITKDGYIYVKKNGGSDPVIAPSKSVLIHTEKGKVPGVFGWPAIHVRKDSKEVPNLKNIFIDCGCTSRKEVHKLGIDVGCVVTFDESLKIYNDKFIVGRALDNRIGGFMIAQVARHLKEKEVKLPFGLYIVNSVQEEIGLNGARMIANKIRPDLAIVTDVCHDTASPLVYNKIIHGDTKCGHGPVLTVGASVHKNVYKMLTGVALVNAIKFQKKVASRTTGTDTDAFAFSRDGVASGLISLPLKYMHTTAEMASISDIKQTIRLIYKFLKHLKAGHDFRDIK